MKYAKPVLIALAVTLLGLLAPLLVLVALPFARWDETPSADSNGQHPEILRGDLPAWAAWLATPDERLPGGTYEPKVYSIWWTFDRFWCSWYWLGVRNRLHGLAALFAVPIDMPWSPEPGYYERGGLWWLRKSLPLGFQLKAGWRTYVLWQPALHVVAVPCFTITR